MKMIIVGKTQFVGVGEESESDFEKKIPVISSERVGQGDFFQALIQVTAQTPTADQKKGIMKK